MAMISPAKLFPPVNSGGLIEAIFSNQKFLLLKKFPPVNSGGLIEAWSWLDFTDQQTSTFPPVNSGGLIEAGT